MARRPSQNQGQTLVDIREAAFRLFGQYGHDGVSMSMVASAAGITKAALYWHYEGKQALYLQSLEAFHGMIREFVFERMVRETTPSAQLMALFEGIGQLLVDSRIQAGVAGFWLEPNTAEVPEYRQILNRFDEAATALLAGIIRQGTEAGEFDFIIPVEDMAAAIICTMEALLVPLRRQGAEDSSRLISALAHTFFRAHANGDELSRQAMALAAGPVGEN